MGREAEKQSGRSLSRGYADLTRAVGIGISRLTMLFIEALMEAAMLKKTASRTIACASGILLSTLLAALMPGFPAPARGCSACAGPGSDVYVRAHIVIKDGTMSRLDVLWDLSETLAQSLAVQHDRNQDGRLYPAERLALEEAFVSGLRVGNYHTALFVNAQELEPLPLDNPRVEWRGTSPQFLFSIPLQEPVGDGLQLRLRTHDPEMHLQFYHRQDSVSWNQPACCRLNDNSQLFPRELEMDIQPRGVLGNG